MLSDPFLPSYILNSAAAKHSQMCQQLCSRLIFFVCFFITAMRRAKNTEWSGAYHNEFTQRIYFLLWKTTDRGVKYTRVCLSWAFRHAERRVYCDEKKPPLCFALTARPFVKHLPSSINHWTGSHQGHQCPLMDKLPSLSSDGSVTCTTG